MRNTINVTKAAALAITALILGSVGQARAGLMTYTNQAAFVAAAPGVATQTFPNSAGNGGVVGVNNPLDSTTNDGYITPGEILPGLSISATTNNGGDIALTGAGFSGVSNPAVFSNYFAGMNYAFSPSVTAASVDVLTLFNSADVTVSVYSPTSILLGTFTVSNAPNSGTGEFFGVIATGGDTIGSIGLTAAGGNSPGTDQVQFGQAAATVPEPASLTLLGLGFAGLMGFAGVRRRKKAAQAA